MGKNQHYVPQYLFRRFSDRSGAIGLLVRKNGKVVLDAPIRNQCSRNNFYKSEEVEQLLGKAESKHAQCLSAWADWAHYEDAAEPSDLDLANLWEAILLQRSRTYLEATKHRNIQESFTLKMFRQYLCSKNTDGSNQRAIDAIDAGQVTLRQLESHAVLQSVSFAMQEVPLISDLFHCIIVNETDYPFIFSDSPVVFYNSYCRNVRNRGVLGYQCPGLQIFFPIDRRTLVMLYDPEKYHGKAVDQLIFPLLDRNDVSQLNCLQLHHSCNGVYFGSESDLGYVCDLWAAHKKNLKTPEALINFDADFLVDGKRPEGNLVHMFEPQIDYDLRLSFIDSNPVRESEYIFRPRSPELHAESKARSSKDAAG